MAVFYFNYRLSFLLSLHLSSIKSLKKSYQLPAKKLSLKNHSKNIPEFEKPTQKPFQKIALKNNRNTIHKIFILIKAKSKLTGK